MNRNTQEYYYNYRIRLEKLKHKTWRLVIFARLLLFLVIIASYCCR